MRSPSSKDQLVDIKSLDLSGVERFLVSIGEPKERGLRVYKQLWQKGVRTFDEMNTIAKTTRKKLNETAYISFLEVQSIFDSSDGTKKFLWKLPSGGVVESVLIPDENRDGGLSDRLTLCVSSQWGCTMKCSFNMSRPVRQSIPNGM